MNEEILSFQNKYDEKPYYILKIQAQACFLDIFINNIPVFSIAAQGGISNEIPINYEILKSGKQNLKIRLTPLFNKTKLSKEIELDVDAGFYMVQGERNLGEYTQCETFILPHDVKDLELPFFEIEVPFEAKVPWDYSKLLVEAQNIQKNPNARKLIDKAVLKLYDALKNKDQKTFNNLYLNLLKRQSDVMYSSDKEIKEYIEYLNLSKVKKVLPLPEYEVLFFAEGKLARVISKEIDEDGNRYVIKYIVPPLMDGGMEGESAENQLFYLPKNKTELEFF